MAERRNDERMEPAPPMAGRETPENFWIRDAIPASTVIIVRDSAEGIETLMLKRDADLAFAGGMWVFPGGRIDDADMIAVEEGSHGSQTSEPQRSRKVPPPTQSPDARGARLELASRVAATRETTEETGLAIDPDQMMRWSHWTAPVQTPRRFTTAFYVAAVEADHPLVIIDDGEIREFRWLSPSRVIEQHATGELGLTPPTYITLTQLVPFDNAAALIESATARSVEHYATRFGFIDDVMVAMYHGDSGYESTDVKASGARHRLSMGSPWTYERDG